MASSNSLGDLFDSFKHEAFRLETLDDYSASGNVDAFRTFLSGGPQPKDYNAEWVAEVEAATRSGKRIYRVHVLKRPLTPYLRFELGWGYRKNSTAGEEFFILDTTDGHSPLADVGDFWLFDSTEAATMRYDESGRFLGAEIVPLPRSAEYVTYRNVALDHAQPFAPWWEQHGGV
ncbi:hypothetical protein RVR_6575 [Actinacidiphila reveromycinica]|uniref:DUF6879 domain-containing protein n=1 Tax=Actinacidiphila reveromycinica TaxID=659352 RepID=A0A7U3UWD0_9ACTN|nr:DUF6879 family protein [Streptomyces sp. SN-593]BBA99798.1 hypothetical protein RVR_6575 [Streptomyces sp. SN-593]